MFSINNKTQIICKTRKEALEVLDYIEKRHPEIRWHSGNKPTKWTHFVPPLSIVKTKGQRIGVGPYEPGDNIDIYITASELLSGKSISISKTDLINFLGE